MRMSIIIILLFLSLNLCANQFFYDGIPIIAPGIFVKGCIYGEQASLSDHAPVIYPRQFIGTWNLAHRASHEKIGTSTNWFLNHKFKTNEEQTLVAADGKPVLFHEKSEVSVRGRPNRYYGIRLRLMMGRIKEMMVSNNLRYFALQEVPSELDTDVDGANLRSMMSVVLAPEFTINFSDHPEDNVALVSPRDLKVQTLSVEHSQRLQVYSLNETTCLVVVHFPYVEGEEGLGYLYGSMENLVHELYQNFANVIFVGDFNTSAKNIDNAARGGNLRRPVIVTSRQGFSCKDNHGTHVDENIDLLVKFSKKEVKRRKRVRYAKNSNRSFHSGFHDNRILFVDNNVARLFDIKSGACICEFHHAKNIISARFNSLGDTILTASPSGVVNLWNAKTCGFVGRRISANELPLSY